MADKYFESLSAIFPILHAIPVENRNVRKYVNLFRNI